MNIVYLTEATIKCYSDYECTKELTKDGSAYTFRLGPEKGLNGTDGDSITQNFYIKNIGDTEANNIFIEEIGDNSNLFKLGTPGSNICSDYLPIGVLAPGEIKQILLYILLPQNCEAVDLGYINYNIYYNTVPVDDTTVFYQDTKNIDTLYLNNETDDYLEYTIPVEALTATGSNANVEMNPPVKLVYGAKDQVKFDETKNKYTIRLQCPYCKTWTSWYDLDSFNVHTGATCSSCLKQVSSSINVNTVGKDTGEHEYTTKKIDFTESSWVLNNATNSYEIELNTPGIVVSVYKKNTSGTYGLVLSNYKRDNGKLIVTSLNKFDGYLLIVNNTFGNVLSKVGRSYGYGAFGGNNNYGQEGLFKITDAIDMEVPISGQKVVNMVASYTILTKYNGKEPNIEDIQSFYTERYNMLGCYDGPALPLWIDETF